MSFHDIRFPVEISLGTVGGPERAIEIVELANGHEIRSSKQAHSRRRYAAGFGVKTYAQLYDIIEFYEARQGKLNAFRWKDWSDYQSCAPGRFVHFTDQIIGFGDDQKRVFQLCKTYRSGAQEVKRIITKPVAETVVVGIDQSRCVAGEDYELDARNGRIEFLAPPKSGAYVLAGFEFDVPVRFDCDQLEINLSHFEAGEIPNIPIIEIRE